MTFSNKKILIQLFLVFFIILNLFDFFNALPSDIDFFKKILSWTIIGYIFYKSSPTKIFIGKRQKINDLIYIIGFSFIAIVKSLALYSRDYESKEFLIFNFIIENIFNSNLQNLIFYSMSFGILVLILNSIYILKKYGFEKKSFIGSINFSEYFKFIKTQYIVLILYSMFFAFIIFNFIMEWFALAVDSIILVLGLIFYIFKYFHSHTQGKVSNLLQKITNTGNEFYKNLIRLFSNKKTIFIGMSFLLTLHLLVDAGVYLVPYTIGTENTLYFDSLNTEEREHLPLFNIGSDSTDLSQISKDFKIIENSSIFILISIGIIYISQIIFFLILMIFPFYIYYNNIQKNKIKLKKKLVIIFLSSLILFSVIFLFLEKVNNPILFSSPQSNLISGVDIYTNNVIEEISFELSISSIVFFVVGIFLILTYLKHKIFFEKVFLFSILAIFIFYIGIFYMSSIEREVISIQNNHNLNSNYEIINSNDKYSEKFTLLRNKNLYSNNKGYSGNYGEVYFDVIPFSDLKIKENNFVEYGEIHNDYLYLSFSKKDKSIFNFEIKNIENVYFKEDMKYEEGIIFFEDNEMNLIYELGKNVFTLRKSNEGYFVNDRVDISSIILSVEKNFKQETNVYVDKFKIFIEYLRIIFLSIFYIFGLVSFIKFYLKENF